MPLINYIFVGKFR